MVNKSVIKVKDDFAREIIKSNLGTLNTRFSADPAFHDGDEKVN